MIPAVRGTDDTTLELGYRFIVLNANFFKFRFIFKYPLFFLSFYTAVKLNLGSTDISKFSGQSRANLPGGQRSQITMNIWFSFIKLLSFVKYSYIGALSCHLCSIQPPPPSIYCLWVSDSSSLLVTARCRDFELPQLPPFFACCCCEGLQ